MERKKDHKNDRLPIFTERFRELQGERSNTEFADFLDISRQTVGFYCNGDRVPDAMTLVRISRKCNVSSDWLLGLSETKALDGDLKQVCNYTGLSDDAAACMHTIYSTPTNGDKSVLLRLVEDIISEGYRFIDFAWKAGVSELAHHRGCEAEGLHSGPVPATMLESALSENVDGFIKIPAVDAASFYVNEAVRHISSVASNIIQEYITAFISGI